MRALILSLFAILLFIGCTVIKREHLNGYYIGWNKKKVKEESNVSKSTSEQGLVKLYVQSENIIEKRETKKEVNENNFNKNLTYNSQIIGSKENINNLYLKSTGKKMINNVLISKHNFFNNIHNSIKYKNQYLLEGKLSAKNKGGDNQIVALLLCFFLGMLGIHSFYLGNKRKGIIQLVMFLVGLLTFLFIIGYLIWLALGIWVFVDFIRIIIGDLGPGW